VMVMLAEDCGRVRALSELLCIMGGGGGWKEGGCAWVQRGRKFGGVRSRWWLLVVLAWHRKQVESGSCGSCSWGMFVDYAFINIVLGCRVESKLSKVKDAELEDWRDDKSRT
jgi:hypothetical protein